MTKFYFLAPLIFLAAFGFVYRRADADRQALEGRREATRVEAKRIEEERKAEAQRKATAEAQVRAAAREQQLRDAAEKKRREHEALVQKLEGETAERTAEADRLEGDAKALALQLANLRLHRDTVEREAFNLAKDVEQKRVDRRNAELEIQRATRMFITRLDRSPMLNPPVEPLRK